MKKTKILAAADIHGDRGLAKKLAEKAHKEGVDLVILAGDLTFFDTDTRDLIGPFIKHNKPVLLLHGNHESIATVDWLSESYPQTKNLHGYAVTHNNIGIFGAGGADVGIDAMTEKGFLETLREAHSKLKNVQKKIMVTHMHPKGTRAEFIGIEGSEGIRKAIEELRPDIMLSGHIHEAEGLTEKIGNTTFYSIGRRGKIFEI